MFYTYEGNLFIVTKLHSATEWQQQGQDTDNKRQYTNIVLEKQKTGKTNKNSTNTSNVILIICHYLLYKTKTVEIISNFTVFIKFDQILYWYFLKGLYF